MKRRVARSYLFLGLSLVAVLLLSACVPPEQPDVVVVPTTEPGAAAATPSSEEQGLTVGTAGVTNAQNVLVTASSLLDLNFQNLAGESIGEIEDFIVNMQNGQIPYATIEYGGVLDIGDTEVAVPLTAFDWTTDGALMLNVDETVLENYPALAQGWANFADPAWDDELFQFWQDAGVEMSVENMTETANNLVWASEATDYNVADSGFGGGDVSNMLIDLGQGMAEFVVLNYEPGLFTNELIAVPLSAFVWQGVGNELAFAPGITQDVLAAAPGFAAADLDTGIFDTTWDDNLTTYWEGAGFAALPGIGAGESVTQTTPATGGSMGQGMGVVGAENAYVLGTTLLDYDFENIDGQVSGEIEDVIMDSSNGQILFVTLEYGGFLDIGDTELPVPLSAFQIGPAGRLVLRFPEEILQDFPDLGTNWGDFTDPAWEDDVVGFWRNAGFEPGFDITEPNLGIVRASTLIGYPVADIGYGVSRVQNLVVNLGQSTVPYVLVDFDTLGVGGELVAIPFTAFDANRFGSEFVFAEGWDATALQDAPLLDPGTLGTGPVDSTQLGEWNTYWEEQGIDVMETE